MGSDNIFKRRKGQVAAALQRKKKSRSKGPRFLIVCEGQKTEPYYFEEFCQLHQLLTSRVKIVPSHTGSSPNRVVDYAEQLYDEDALLGGDSYDKIFCVFDRDTHSTFKTALTRIDQLAGAGKPFTAIPSYPCFEYWFLLRFKYTRMPFYAKGKRTIADNVIQELRQQPGFNAYSKAKKNTFEILRTKTDIAIKHSKQAAIEAEQTDEKNPSTLVHVLVEALSLLAQSHGKAPPNLPTPEPHRVQ